MRATLEFELPEDGRELRRALQVDQLTGALWSVYQGLRRRYKYTSDELTEGERREREQAYGVFWDALENHGLELEDLE